MTNGFGVPPGQPAGQPAQGYGAPNQGIAPNQGGAPYQAGPSQAAFPLSPSGMSNARQMGKWLKFLGVLSMIGGGVYCLSIVGAVVGWLPLLTGYWQYKASEGLQRFSESGEVGALETSLDNLRLYYTVIGIMAIVSMGLGALVVLSYIAMFLFMGAAVFGAAAGGG